MPLKIVKRKGSPFWYIRGTVAGREIFESTGRDRRADAEAVRIAREHELNTARNEDPDEKLFSEALAAYLRAVGEKTYADRLFEALGCYTLSEIDQEILDRAARETYPTQSVASLRRWFYDPVVTVMNFAARQKWTPYRKFSKPKVKRPPPQYVELEWLEKLWAASNARLVALTKFLVYTGCRISECVNLTWDNVNLEEGLAFIPKTKNGQPRTVILTQAVVDAIAAIEKKDERVFGYADRWTARNAIKRACARAEIPYRRPHVIGSHTYATWMRRYQGIDAVGLVATGRWKDPRSTMIYAHAAPSEDAKKAHNLPGAGGAEKKKSVQKSVQKKIKY